MNELFICFLLVVGQSAKTRQRRESKNYFSSSSFTNPKTVRIVHWIWEEGKRIVSQVRIVPNQKNRSKKVSSHLHWIAWEMPTHEQLGMNRSTSK
jgi:hypothetical protein